MPGFARPGGFKMHAVAMLASVIVAAFPINAHAQKTTSNYDESKVGTYTLPDPLVLANGRKLTTSAQWTQERRPELLHLFETHVYGKVPVSSKLIQPRFVVKSDDRGALGGTAIRRELSILFSDEVGGPQIDLLLFIPKKASAAVRVPAFLGMNFRGNQSVDSDPGITLSRQWMRPNAKGVVNNRATEASRGIDSSSWPVKQILARGYALATFYYGDVDADYDDGFKNGIHPLFYHAGQTRPATDEWGSIGAWAWGLSRALDYLETAPEIDSRKVAVMGHSRLGKAALWAGAEDPRFALVVSVQSGCGGAALSRRIYGETVEQINRAFPHWFCANFRQYNSHEEKLPIDQHELIALVAPRPVLICSAEDDRHADPKGEFLAALGADPVYRLLGTDGLAVTELPKPASNQLTKSTIGFHFRPGKHQVTAEDWRAMMAFADHHLKQGKELTRLSSLVLSLSPVATVGELKVGAAASPLVADDTMVIGGGIGPHKVTGQEGELRAAAVVIEDPQGAKVALVACDVLMLNRDILDQAAHQIEHELGIPFDHILINATHTHSAPTTASIHGYTREEAFTRQVGEKIVQATIAAAKRLAPATMQFRLGEESSVGRNSRLLLSDGTIFWTGSNDDAVRPTGPFDPELPVWAFRRPGGALEAVMFNHSTHTIGGHKPGVRSPCFYGLAAQDLEKQKGGTFVFFEGASGSTHNLDVRGPEMTLRISQAVTRALESAQPRPVNHVKGIRSEFSFKVRHFDEAADEKAVTAYCTKRIKDTKSSQFVIGVFRNMRKELAPQQGQLRKTWIQAILIGDIAVVGVPGEFFTVLGQEIKRRSPYRYTYVFELANDYIGYIPDRHGHELGGYQTWTGLHSFLEPGTGEAIVAEAIKLLDQLHQTRAPSAR